ncbi:choline kinase alpha [Pelomyxa schiedti]|nr:choline kinase alpha [Pelomyxa schiedti]
MATDPATLLPVTGCTDPQDPQLRCLLFLWRARQHELGLVSSEPPPPEVVGHRMRVLMCGVWDLLHPGHAQAMERVKEKFPHCWLIIGVHSDQTTASMKGKPVLTMKERAEMVRHIKYVDEVLLDCPWAVDKSFLDSHMIDLVVGSDDSFTSKGKSIYEEVQKLGKFVEIPRIEGISSTSIISRIVSNYDAYINRTLDCGYSLSDLNVSYLRGMRVSTSRGVKKVMRGFGFGANWRISGFTRRFGEKILQSWAQRGLAKELRLAEATDPSYPSAASEETSTSSEDLSEIFPWALKQCKELVNGWKNVDVSEISIKVIKGGLTNRLYKLSLSPEATERLNEAADPASCERVPQHVLVRKYGEGTEVFFDRSHEHIIFSRFSDARLGPHLYGLFEGGRIEEFLELQSLTSDEVPNVLLAIAQQLANVHRLEIEDLPHTPSLFNSLRHWYEAAMQVTFDDPKKKLQLSELGLEKLGGEIDELQGYLRKIDSPMCFCHNDLLGGNIMYDNESKKLCFIDFEYGSYNYRGFDFGNHFNEWMLVYSEPHEPWFRLEPSHYPSYQQQHDFFSTYLRQYLSVSSTSPTTVTSGEPVPPATTTTTTATTSTTTTTSTATSEEALILSNPERFEQAVQGLIAEANQFSLASHILWAVWSVIQASSSSIQFGYLEFAQARIKEYYKRKNDYLVEHVYTKSYCEPHVLTETPSPATTVFVSNDDHHFVEARFNIPTWCKQCGYFVRSPFGKQGYRCQACGMCVHRNCKDNVVSKCVFRKQAEIL